MNIRISLALLAGLVCAGGLGTLTSQLFPMELTSLVQNSAQLVTPDYDRTFGSTWQSIRIFRLLQPLDKPLKVYVNTQPSALFRPHYVQYVTQGLKSWSAALDNRFSFELTNNPKDADIQVNWVESFPDRYTAGLATYRIGHADIQIKTVGVPDKDIQANIIHELGHAMGIAGHSTDQNDIMVGMRRWRKDDAAYQPKLSANDINAVQRLYSSRWNKGEDLYVAMRNDAKQAKPSVEVAASPTALVESQSRKLEQDIRPDAYLSELRQKITASWTSPQAAKPVVVQFQVNAQGQLAVCRVQQSSGSAQVDAAALQTVRSAVRQMPQTQISAPMSLEIALR